MKRVGNQDSWPAARIELLERRLLKTEEEERSLEWNILTHHDNRRQWCS